MKIISPTTPQQLKDYYNLRWEVLRKPWGKPEGSERDDLEDNSYHFLLLNNEGETAAVCRLQLNSGHEAQLRYMAVNTTVQGKGYGSIILLAAEKKAKELNCKTVVLHSRENAVAFYQKNGFRIIDKSYLMWSEIQHYLMQKTI